MKLESSFGARLRQVMVEHGWNYDELSRQVRRTPQTLNRYVLGQREPKAVVASEIACSLGVDPLWLQGYDVLRDPRIYSNLMPAGQEVLVPILGVIRAGAPMLASQDIQGYAPADVKDPQEHFYLRVTGDSMAGAGIKEGDLVLLHQQSSAENGQIVACLLDGENATLKRFRRHKDTIILQPENPAYEPRFIPAQDFDAGAARIVGVAVRLMRNL